MGKVIQTNSELPLCLLDRNEELNGMDFVLYHLYISNEIYRSYYRNLRLKNPHRPMILDNSAYEFHVTGRELDMEDFVRVINELVPDMYILPDTLMDRRKTLQATRVFLDKWAGQINPRSRPMAVAQGNSPKDLMDCLGQYEAWGIRYVALPFHNEFYKKTDTRLESWWTEAFKDYTEDMRYAAGRCDFVLKNKDYLKGHFDYIHLLGSHSPYEKRVLTVEAPVVDSMDTGYPVKVGYAGYKMFTEPSKPEVIIDDFLEEDLSEEIKTRIVDNVGMFRRL